MINYDKVLEEFKNYVNEQRKILNTFMLSPDDIKIRMDGIDKKLIHSLEVVLDGVKVMKELKFNDSFTSFSKVALLNHDIGRFMQICYTGSFNDLLLSKSIFKVNDHGILGGIVLKKEIINQIEKTRIFDDPLINIVNNHVSKINSDDELSILGDIIFQNEDCYKLFKNGDTLLKMKIISSITQIVQDIDRLDIFHQILEDRFIPLKNDSDIDPIVFDMFYRGEYLDMNFLRNKQLWNPNVGELVRLGFINNIKLLSVAKIILNENIILKLKEKRQNPKVKDAFDYTNDILKEMINNSTDGITVSKIKQKKNS